MKSKLLRKSAEAAQGIVVDALIAHSAGMSPASQSKQCLNFLDVFEKETNHEVVISLDIREEWDRHKSKYSSRWLTSMQNAGRLRRIQFRKDKTLWGAFNEAELTAPAYADLHKDLLLVEAAINADKRVSSLDGVKKHFAKCVACNPAIGDVAWVNPTV